MCIFALTSGFADGVSKDVFIASSFLAPLSISSIF